MLVRRFSDATVTELHRLRPHILMDAGELGSRNVSVCWIEVPAGTPYALYARVRAITGDGVSTWSAPFGFNTSWDRMPEPLDFPRRRKVGYDAPKWGWRCGA